MTFIIELSQKITATKVIFGVRSKIGIIIVAIHNDVATTKFLIGFTPHCTAHFYRSYNIESKISAVYGRLYASIDDTIPFENHGFYY